MKRKLWPELPSPPRYPSRSLRSLWTDSNDIFQTKSDVRNIDINYNIDNPHIAEVLRL